MTLPARKRDGKRGGTREGAGRKPIPGSVSHARRPALASRYPVHVTLKLLPVVESLREAPYCNLVAECLRAGKEREGFRLVHYSIQGLHLHLIVEALNAMALASGIKGLSVRIAKRLNKELGRKGRVFAQRYNAHILRTPTGTRAALFYALNNSRRHAAQVRERYPRDWVDPHSSAAHFDGWHGLRPRPPPDEEPAVVPAKTWLLTSGWRFRGLLDINAVPGSFR